MKKYAMNSFKKTMMLLRSSDHPKDQFFCEECPKPDEIIWKNIGTTERQEQKLTFKSIAWYFVVLALALAILVGISRFIYFDSLTGTLKTALVNIVLLFVAVLIIAWRLIMNQLSEMRFPYTLTKRVMYVIITTVLLHFFFYLWIPSLFLKLFHDYRGSTLNLVSNQAITTVIVQLILVFFDFFYCLWNKRRRIVEDEDKPIGCQKMLH